MNYLNDTPIDYTQLGVVDALEQIRQAGVRLMGLDPLAQAQPKVAVLKPASRDNNNDDIVINAFSMGVLHCTVPMTVGLCLSVAACVSHTLAWEALGGRCDTNELLRISPCAWVFCTIDSCETFSRYLDMMDLSPTVAMASRAQRSGKTFTEVYADHRYVKKNTDYDRMARTLAQVLAQIEECVCIF
jgi:hypothetical protein